MSAACAAASEGVAPLRATATRRARELASPLATTMVYSLDAAVPLGIPVPSNDLIHVHSGGPTLGSAKRSRPPGGSGPAPGMRGTSCERAAKRACVMIDGEFVVPGGSVTLRRQVRVTRKLFSPFSRETLSDPFTPLSFLLFISSL